MIEIADTPREVMVDTAPDNDTTAVIDILLVGGDQAFRDQLRTLLEAQPGLHVVADVPNSDRAIRAFGDYKVDVVIVNPAGRPLARATRALRNVTVTGTRPHTILFASHVMKTNVVRAEELGVRGIVTKGASPAVWSACIQSVVSGHAWLGSAPVFNLAEALPPSLRTGSAFGLTRRELDVIAAVVGSLVTIAKIADPPASPTVQTPTHSERAAAQ